MAKWQIKVTGPGKVYGGLSKTRDRLGIKKSIIGTRWQFCSAAAAAHYAASDYGTGNRVRLVGRT